MSRTSTAISASGVLLALSALGHGQQPRPTQVEWDGRTSVLSAEAAAQLAYEIERAPRPVKDVPTFFAGPTLTVRSPDGVCTIESGTVLIDATGARRPFYYGVILHEQLQTGIRYVDPPAPPGTPAPGITVVMRSMATGKEAALTGPVVAVLEAELRALSWGPPDAGAPDLAFDVRSADGATTSYLLLGHSSVIRKAGASSQFYFGLVLEYWLRKKAG